MKKMHTNNVAKSANELIEEISADLAKNPQKRILVLLDTCLGAGEKTFVNEFCRQLPKEINMITLNLQDWRQQKTDSIDIREMLDAVINLLGGKPAVSPIHDLATGKSNGNRILRGTQVILMKGQGVFSCQRLVLLADYKVFVYADNYARLARCLLEKSLTNAFATATERVHNFLRKMEDDAARISTAQNEADIVVDNSALVGMDLAQEPNYVCQTKFFGTKKEDTTDRMPGLNYVATFDQTDIYLHFPNADLDNPSGKLLRVRMEGDHFMLSLFGLQLLDEQIDCAKFDFCLDWETVEELQNLCMEVCRISKQRTMYQIGQIFIMFDKDVKCNHIRLGDYTEIQTCSNRQLNYGSLFKYVAQKLGFYPEDMLRENYYQISNEIALQGILAQHKTFRKMISGEKLGPEDLPLDGLQSFKIPFDVPVEEPDVISEKMKKLLNET